VFSSSLTHIAAMVGQCILIGPVLYTLSVCAST